MAASSGSRSIAHQATRHWTMPRSRSCSSRRRSRNFPTTSAAIRASSRSPAHGPLPAKRSFLPSETIGTTAARRGNSHVSAPRKPRFCIAVHGGAGTVRRSTLTPTRERAIHQALRAALAAGAEILQHGGSSLDAVAAAGVALEDAPLFNAGKGAGLTADGRHELDAAIMDGATRQAGAGGGVRRPRHPGLLAGAVMDNSPPGM